MPRKSRCRRRQTVRMREDPTVRESRRRRRVGGRDAAMLGGCVVTAQGIPPRFRSLVSGVERLPLDGRIRVRIDWLGHRFRTGREVVVGRAGGCRSGRPVKRQASARQRSVCHEPRRRTSCSRSFSSSLGPLAGQLLQGYCGSGRGLMPHGPQLQTRRAGCWACVLLSVGSSTGGAAARRR